MTDRIEFITQGFANLERELLELPKVATAKNVTRRAAITAMKRVEVRAKQMAPKDEGDLADSITTKPVKAKRESRTRFAASNDVSVATGPTGRQEGGNPAWQEFGTVKQAAQPYMRPAADAESENVINDFGRELAVQIEKAKARIARKLARG